MRAPPFRRLGALALLTLAAACADNAAGPRSGSGAPESARLITDDIPRFWAAFDQMTGPTDTMPLRRNYLDRGTKGLTEFTDRRWKNAATLAAAVWPRHAYYASVRANTLRVASLEPQIRRAFRTLDTLYAGAVFPYVYFCFGAMATGGTTSPAGLLIGTELFALAPESPLGELTPWHRSVVRPLEMIPGIVAHELVHYQQRSGGNRSTLLARAIGEGSADFVGELISGQLITEPQHAYGDAHEADLWAEFRVAMRGTDISRWLYNGDRSTDRPADLGYYIGYRITEAYYRKASNKRRALRDILTIQDFDAFLTASGYAGR